MKKQTQREKNPYKNSDSNKRYYTYEYYLRKTFGSKCAKIPIDGGFSCPNIDGTCGRGGCIFCSGDFAPTSSLSIEDQFSAGVSSLSAKWKTDKSIAYFQAHTNTYAPVCILKEKFEAALALPGVVGLNIATRADCLEDEKLEYLATLAERTVLTLELGLQSSNDETAKRINRGHDFETFADAVKRIRKASEKINICVHLIFGLPGEGFDDMIESARAVAALEVDQVKLHMLYVMEGTRLGKMFLSGEYFPIEREEYIKAVAEAIALMPEKTVIARLTGDASGEGFLAPEWSRRKIAVINDIDKYMFENNLWQGKNFSCGKE